jgi:type IV secretory pathway TrbD component
MSQLKPKGFTLLLQVFRYGLRLGIISKDEVVAWADEIIQEEDEPDYFFIEISLSKDANELLAVLNKNISGDMPLMALRVVLGLFYKKLAAGDISVDFAIGKIESTDFLDGLTSFEAGDIYELEDYEFFEVTKEEAKEGVLQFLSRYKDFSLEQPEEWPDTNTRLEELLKDEEAQAIKFREVYFKRLKKEQLKSKLRKAVLIGILVLVALVVCVTDAIYSGQGYSIWYINVFAIYFFARVGPKLWRTKRSWR